MHAVTSRVLLALIVLGVAPNGDAASPAAVASELPAVLRLDDALRLLRERGIDILIAEAAISAAEGDVRIAGAVMNPALSLSYGRSFTYGHCSDVQGNLSSCGNLPEPQYGVGLSD